MTWICKDRKKKKKNTRLHVDVLSRLLVAPGGSIKGAICHVRCKIKNSSVWCLQSWLDSGLHLRRYTKFRTQIMLFFSVTFLQTVSQQTKGCLEPLLFFLSLSLSPAFYCIGCTYMHYITASYGWTTPLKQGLHLKQRYLLLQSGWRGLMLPLPQELSDQWRERERERE